MAKVGRRLKLTPELQQTISSYIRAGAFAWVAAEAAGVSEATFYRWMELGARGRRQFREFREAISTARAEARVAAEIRVYQHDPATWLLRGPGREKRGQPGWSASADVTLHHDPTEVRTIEVVYVNKAETDRRAGVEVVRKIVNGAEGSAAAGEGREP